MTSYQRLLISLLALSLLPSAYGLNMSPPQVQHLTKWDSASSELARQIAALTGPGTIALSVTNRSTIPADEVPAIRRGLERELRSSGLAVREKNADCDVRVTLSQNVQGWLWVAEVQEGIEIKVAMLPVAGSSAAAPVEAAPAMTLQSTLLQSGPEPILDFVRINSGAEQYTIALGPDKITVYSPALQTFDIPHAQPLPRDLRGRVVPAADHLFDAYLSGIVCAAKKNADNAMLNVSCANSDDPWPLGSQKAFYNSARNFFTGVVVPGFGPKLPPFYSAAELVRTSSTVFLFADVSGAVHTLDSGSHKLLIGARDWGSDIAAVNSQCGSGTQVLASAAGWPASDSLRAYEIQGREATPVSPPVSFDGTIAALWPAVDGSSAIVIVRKPRDAGYGAYNVSVVCGH